MFWTYRIQIFLFACLFVNTSLASPETFSSQLVRAAQERTKLNIIYDGSYRSITYPMGDVPKDKGVCTDLIIRVYRELEVDLQKLVHEDMRSNFSNYPNKWGLTSPDTNIDHRRVLNLQTFFERHGKVLKISSEENDYQSGDLVTWMLPGNLLHIGIVSNQFVKNTARRKIIHNIGNGPVEDDILFNYKITGHYRYEQ
jgi:uncharacterized protein YijF (DUF1287 family)